jgi:hypothetical protein
VFISSKTSEAPDRGQRIVLDCNVRDIALHE